MIEIFEEGDRVKITDEGIESIKEEPSFYSIQSEDIEKIIDTEGEIVFLTIEGGEDYFCDVDFNGIVVEGIGLGYLDLIEGD